ncbi:anthrone oxygenase family protein [Marinivivus vitaminiproducens]|uniref:anthrone oxygenase family protein n=1 Tax=Marinivivus vitaminiproducens TaxID=3035935 RepID=UPI0027A2BEA3|nr:DUF1772 domain-containing protein [Geminicoccaceae bacterium SCSIO 64248]
MTLAYAVRALATLWSGLMAGFFFAFSIVVMPALETMPPDRAMAAMQAINAAVRTPFFGIAFFGAVLLCAATLALSVWGRGRSFLGTGAAVVYLAGAFATTVAFNVPLNNELAALDPTVPEQAALMTGYIVDWTGWNHVRTLAAMAACVLLLASLITSRARANDDYHRMAAGTA